MGEVSNILVTGAGGQVGTALRSVIPAADFRSREQLDVTDRDAVAGAARDKAWIVHAAAMTDVDGCEAAPEVARAVNAEGTRNVVEAARSNGARVLYVSTDYVFSGDSAPYDEVAEPHPLGTYGTTKLEGELALDESVGDLIVRSSWIFGVGRNFVSTIIGAARKGPVSVVDDQIGRPTAADALAIAIGWLLEHAPAGVVHVAGDGPPCSWADLAEAAIEEAGLSNDVERVDTATYTARSTSLVARRPPDSTLSLERARSFGVPLIDWRASLGPYVRSLS